MLLYEMRAVVGGREEERKEVGEVKREGGSGGEREGRWNRTRDREEEEGKVVSGEGRT